MCSAVSRRKLGKRTGAMSKSLGHAIAPWFKKEDIEMSIDTKSRHRTKSGGNVFLDLGFPPKEAKRLLAHADAQIDVSIRLKRQLMDEIAEWMKAASVTQAAAAEVL